MILTASVLACFDGFDGYAVEIRASMALVLNASDLI
jgi:hypothetical protein